MDRSVLFILLLCLASFFALGSALNLMKAEGKDAAEEDRTEDRTEENSSCTILSSEELTGIIDRCNNTFPTPVEHLSRLNDTGTFPGVVDRDSKCYLYCLFSRLKVFDERGNANLPAMGKMFAIEEEEIKRSDFFQNCLSEDMVNVRDACEQTYERISCLIKERIKLNAGTGKMTDGNIRNM